MLDLKQATDALKQENGMPELKGTSFTTVPYSQVED